MPARLSCREYEEIRQKARRQERQLIDDRQNEVAQQEQFRHSKALADDGVALWTGRPLPDGWEKRRARSNMGRQYYLHTQTQTTQPNRPWSSGGSAGPFANSALSASQHTRTWAPFQDGQTPLYTKEEKFGG